MSTITRQAGRLLGLLGAVATTGALAATPAAWYAPEDSPWTENLRWTLDASSRADAEDGSTAQALGLDVYKVFSGRDGDIGTLILQPYLLWIPDEDRRPAFFDDDREVEITWRIANFNYTGLARGRFNLRAGHMEVPFGLEYDVNTNGTLRQYSNGRNLGLKADWGFSVNGVLPTWQYELALTRGTGQEYHSRDDPYALAGRLGSATSRAMVLGIAVFDGRVRTPAGMSERRRIGIDLRWLRGPIGWQAEASVGDDDNRDVTNLLVEANWRTPAETLLVYTQASRLRRDNDDGRSTDESVNLGLRWTPDNHLALALQLFHSLEQPGGGRGDDSLLLQFRYRL